MASEGAENTIYVTDDPASLAPAVIGSVDGIVACGDGAGALLESLAAAAGWTRPPLPPRAPRGDEALVWFRKSERAVALVRVGSARKDTQVDRAEPREKSAEVGQVLRRA